MIVRCSNCGMDKEINATCKYCIEDPAKKGSALDVQVGGGHYKKYAIQPVEFCQKNKLNYCEANVIKYICRHKDKGGLEDLKKVKHYVDLLIDIEYKPLMFE